MNRRAFLGALGATTTISMLDWLRFFRARGVPGTSRDLGIAEAVAQTSQPRFLVYWFMEGGWDGFSMFNPVATRNDASSSSLPPLDRLYRPAGVPLVGGLYPVQQQGAIRYGHLANAGTSLFGDMAVVSSHRGRDFHSFARLEYHLGTYSAGKTAWMSAVRQPDERSVLHAFAEVHGQSRLMSHVSWHKWLSDGELAIANYPEGTGYYEKLGPAHAHTVYGGTPERMRTRLKQIAASAGSPRDAAIHAFVDDLHANFLADKNSEAVRAFASAVQVHKTFVSKGAALDIDALFTNPALRAEFGVQASDERTTARADGRSKDSPNTNVQALMAYELMTKGLSNAFWIEARDIRTFDTHLRRADAVSLGGQIDQAGRMNTNLWNPLKAFVARLKNTPIGTTGKSYFDQTTIVLCSEMGRHMGGADEDVCQHLNTSSVAFLGGAVKGNTQFGRVGTQTLDAIPILPDGSLDPGFDPTTGLPKPGTNPSPLGFVSDAGHVYATALELAGIPKNAQTGKNPKPPLAFVKKST